MRTRTTAKRWTHAEDSVLVEMMNAGRSVVDIAMMLGRSKGSVYQRLCLTTDIRIRRHFTHDEIDRLRRMATDRASIKDIMEAFPGRSWETIRKCAKKHGIKLQRARCNVVTEEDKQGMLHMRREGASIGEIAHIYKRCRMTVSNVVNKQPKIKRPTQPQPSSHQTSVPIKDDEQKAKPWDKKWEREKLKMLQKQEAELEARRMEAFRNGGDWIAINNKLHSVRARIQAQQVKEIIVRPLKENFNV